MHIVFDARIHMDYMSGMSRYIVMLLKHLFEIDKENQYSILLNNTLSPDNEIFEFNKHPNVSCVTTNFAHMGPKSFLQLPKYLKQLKPDIYHYPHIDTPYFGIPTVSTVHDSNISNGIKRYSDFLGIKTLYFKQTLKQTLKKSKKVIFISQEMKKEVLEDFKMDKNNSRFEVIYNGLDEDFTKFDVVKAAKIKDKFSLEKPFFFYAGALREHKNVKRIIAAFNKANISGYELIMVGSKYDKYPVDLNFPNIRHLGMVSDDELKSLYHYSYAFLFPSLFEGFGLPILEAMSHGSPVLTTNYGATKEVGDNAVLLVDPNSVDEIANGINKLVEDKAFYQTLQNLGYKRISDFSWQVSAKRVLEIYNSIGKEN